MTATAESFVGYHRSMAFICKSDNKKLRDALDAPDGTFVSRHRDYIERVVRQVYPHTVEFRELIDGSTCVPYALGLFRERTYDAIRGNFDRKIFAGKAFMEWLVNGHLVEIDEPKKGCLALYFDKGVWRHVGVVSAPGRVISQWGEYPVYEHGVCEVPARYGNKVRYFEMPGPGEPLKLFLEFAKAGGVYHNRFAAIPLRVSLLSGFGVPQFRLADDADVTVADWVDAVSADT
jgi:hypothetical protein